MQTTTATRWLQRWDAQQERYVPDREERFRVVIDVVRAATDDGPARVVDLGCGPGSLSQRLAEALPSVEVVGVDTDPLLLGLGRANSNPRVRLIEANLANPGWADATGLPGPWDAAVSSTALHWLAPADLGQLYRTLAQNLRPGGVFVNADNMHVGQPRLDALATAVREARTRRVGTESNEDWSAWWQALQQDDELSPLLDARSKAAIAHSGENGLTVWEHAELLRQAGFAEAGPVWQFGDDHVLVAVR
ncbi:methyltransferase domain-containing protein [Actinophytocola sp.]|uniref:methyltransferase domain-containing protein n=1 Tax=Actinophytocola sp. TaxID=1872138 RepID=UPI002ED5C29C